MYKIQGTKGLFINDNLEIVEKENFSRYKLIGSDMIEIDVYGVSNKITLDMLMFIAKNKIFIDHDVFYGKLDLLYKISLTKRYLGKESRVDLLLFKKPFIITHNKIVYKVTSTNTRYALSSKGDILDLITYKNIYPNSAKIADKYSVVNLFNYDGMKTTRLIHRLMGFSWLDNDDWENKTIINHIDGDKSNYNETNLEWCNYKHNNQHAASTGLKSDTKPIKIRNVDTGEILDFPSITLAVQYMKRSRINIQHTNPVGNGKILVTPKGRFELKYKHDNSRWVSEREPYSIITPTQRIRFKIYMDGSSDVIICNNSKDLADFIDKYMPNKISLPNDEFSNNISKFQRNYKNIISEVEHIHPSVTEYICYNTETKEEIIASTRREIMDITGGSKSTIQKSIITDGKYAINDIWYAKANDGKPFAEPIDVVNKGISIQVVDPLGNSVIYTSLRSASQYFGVDKTSLKWAIETRGTLNNHNVSYVR